MSENRDDVETGSDDDVGTDGDTASNTDPADSPTPSVSGDRPAEGDESRRTAQPAGAEDLFLHAFVGAAATVLLGFVPFSPVVGGALAGYLHGRDGIRVGTVAGVIASIPAALLLLLVLGVVGFGTIVADQVRAAFFFAGLFLVSVLILLVYVVGLSALGGLVGVELQEEFEG